ncbi:hypothetical protein [Wolbachia endosymbiont (group A) of Opomyza germinationis]|uniref:hypothetical protein n=1 Tax=Wolbachia endosymbiont (group A) of Opomyza germinationis TaxID=3077917 RepID=UPI0035C8E92D
MVHMVVHAIPKQTLLSLADFGCWKWLDHLILIVYTTKLIPIHLGIKRKIEVIYSKNEIQR